MILIIYNVKVNRWLFYVKFHHFKIGQNNSFCNTWSFNKLNWSNQIWGVGGVFNLYFTLLSLQWQGTHNRVRLQLKCALESWNLEKLVFEERGKPEYPEKNLLEQGRRPTTNSTHIWCWVRKSNPGHIGGRPAWEANAQPLRHPWLFFYFPFILSETLDIKVLILPGKFYKLIN